MSRPRRQRQSYSKFFDKKQEDEDSESDFVQQDSPSEDAVDEEMQEEVVKTRERKQHVDAPPPVVRPPKPGPGPKSNLASKDHRHRPECIWYPATNVYRLAEQPSPCVIPRLVPTSSTRDSAVAHRVGRAWMYSVSTGPRWELVEDRAFYKEEYTENERLLRPRVYQQAVLGSYTILSLTQATPHLPQVGPIHCKLGETLYTFTPFSSVPMDSFVPGEKSNLFFTGGPVVGADWCPSSIDELVYRQGRQYVALSTLSKSGQRVAIGLRSNSPCPSSIQLWSIELLGDVKEPNVRLEQVVCIDEGPALEIKWCPLPAHDNGDDGQPRKLGVLGAITMDGNLNIYVVPDPRSIQGDNIVHVKVTPRVQISLPDTTCNTFDWANSETIAIGCSNGFVATYYVRDAIVSQTNATLTGFFPVHQSAVQHLSWIRVPRTGVDGTFLLTEDPTMISTGASDGSLRIVDTRDQTPRSIVRNREVPHSNAYSSFCGSIVATDIDFLVKLYQIQPATFGKGHNAMDTDGAALSISTSDMHPILAVGSADGSCTTANLLRSTRRGGAVPLLDNKIFQLDYDPTHDQYQMLDHLLPRESGTTEGPTYRESNVKSKSDDPAIAKRRFETGRPEPSGLWHPNVAVNVVSWNSGCGLGCAPFLVSGMACGLARIDFLEGRWMRNTFPYVSIEAIRREGGQSDSASELESE